jgi:glutaredoxin 3
MLTVYSKTHCPYCVNAVRYLSEHNIEFQEIKIDQDDRARQFITDRGHRTVPQIYHGDDLLVEGGWEGLSKLAPNDIRDRISIRNNTLGTL